MDIIKTLIIGSGPAGYTACHLCRPYQPQPGHVHRTGNGRTAPWQTTDVEKFSRYPKGIMGPEMMEEFRQQAERFNTDIRFGYVAKVDFSGEIKRSGWMVAKR